VSKERYYCQCSMSRGNVHTIAYLPEKYAVLDKVLKIKQADESWEDGWVVKSVGERKPHEYLENMDNIWKCSTILTERGRK
jgi:hypothetical protein